MNSLVAVTPTFRGFITPTSWPLKVLAYNTMHTEILNFQKFSGLLSTEWCYGGHYVKLEQNGDKITSNSLKIRKIGIRLKKYPNKVN